MLLYLNYNYVLSDPLVASVIGIGMVLCVILADCTAVGMVQLSVHPSVTLCILAK